jgi:nucleoid-associated protein YgaU
MNQNVGASFGLSVLIVLLFAVILYQPDTPPPPVASKAPIEAVEAHPPADILPPAVVAKPVDRIAPTRVVPDEPRGAFTRVRDGETLSDVAHRIYGGGDAVKTLWLANRDRLDRVDAPLAPGSILRTP